MLEPDLYLIVPILMEQPTWGGSYIQTMKGIRDQESLRGSKIGQSYELAGVSRVIPGSHLRGSVRRDNLGAYLAPAVYELHKAGSGERQLSDAVIAPIALQNLIAQHPLDILGEQVARRFGTVMPVLIKFTQALGNSFQLHVKESDESTTHWLSKPETWFFLEKGSVTLGAKAGCDWAAFEKTCHDIATGMQLLSKHVMKGNLTMIDAEKEADQLVLALNPWQYVNCFRVESGTIVDPSAGGIHHSWEDDPACPLGNIVYEVQRDRSDSASTIRSFDKGKFNPDGSVRPVQVEDYFKFIDRDDQANDPQFLLRQSKLQRDDLGGRTQQLFETVYYGSDLILLNDKSNVWTEQTGGSFHHIFVKEGAIEIGVEGSDTVVGVREGWSVLIPSHVSSYHMQGHGGMKAEVIKTYIPKS